MRWQRVVERLEQLAEQHDHHEHALRREEAGLEGPRLLIRAIIRTSSSFGSEAANVLTATGDEVASTRPAESSACTAT